MPAPQLECTVRLGEPGDVGFLRTMLFEAAYWRTPANRPALDAGLAHPELAKLLRGWGSRQGDTSVVAFAPDGRHLGAAWYRFWTDSSHSYGYVDPTTPEIAIGVAPEARRRGVGRALLEALITQARLDGVPALSLSVERDNGALKLYKHLGFRPVATVGNSYTMLLGLLEGA